MIVAIESRCDGLECPALGVNYELVVRPRTRVCADLSIEGDLQTVEQNVVAFGALQVVALEIVVVGETVGASARQTAV